MNFPRSRKRKSVLPGLVATVRAHRTLAPLLARIRPGDLVVIDQRDLDAETARALVGRRPLAVLNAAEFISGRFANLGPKVLAQAGVLVLEGRREEVLALRDGTPLRLHDGTLYDGAVVALDVRQLDQETIQARMDRARAGLGVQLDSFAHAASEFLRREEGLLLHGTGAPPLRTVLEGRVVVVAGPGTEKVDLRRLRRFVRRTGAALIGVDAGIDRLVEQRLRPDVAVLSGGSVVTDQALRRSREVVLADPGQAVQRQVEKMNLPASVIATSTAPLDIGLLLAQRGGARLVVPVGSPAGLDEFIDRDRNDQASNVLTRLRLGPTVVDGRSVPLVLPSRTRAHWLTGSALLLVAALGAFLALTPAGDTWTDEVGDQVTTSFGNDDALARARRDVADRDGLIRSLTGELGREEALTAATAAALLENSLTGRAVALVTLPGADAEQVAALRTLVADAGAQVTAEVKVDERVAETAQRGLVDALTSQLLTQAKDVGVPSGADGDQRFGALLARAVAVPSSARVQRSAADAVAVSVAAGFQAAGLLTSEITERAALTLLVTGAHTTAQSGTSLAAVVASYGAQVPTVVVGPSVSRQDGVISRLRAQERPFSTVDGTETAAGRVTALLALVARTQGKIGSYGGATAVDGAVPPVF